MPRWATIRRLRQTGERRVVIGGGSAALWALRGAFVSLHHDEELLGCEGNCGGHTPLRDDIADLTLSAALDHPCFQPAAQQRGAFKSNSPCSYRSAASAMQASCASAVTARVCDWVAARAAGHRWTAEDFRSVLARKGMLPPRAWCDSKARLEVATGNTLAGESSGCVQLRVAAPTGLMGRPMAPPL